jgi:uracil DNA glycosylase
VISILNKDAEKKVFLLLGGFAQTKGKSIDRKKHKIISAAHPSPLSVAKFMGSKVFSKVNSALQELGKDPVDWSVPS